jgi:hypothetical protein
MWKEIAATEPPKTTGPAKKWREEFEKKYPSVKAVPKPVTEAKPVTEDELRAILSGLETETRELRSRNAELEEIMRKFAPLLDAATTMGLVAKNEKPEPENHRSLEEQGDQTGVQNH